VPVKLILRESVDHLGSPGEIVSVAPGYARNYLLPKGLAFEATPGNLKMLQRKRTVWEARSMQEVEQAQQLAGRLGALDLKIEKKAGESRTLFGSVTNVEIAAMIAEQGIEIDRRQIVLKNPIKTIGSFEVAVKIHAKVTGQVRLQVLPEGGQVEAQPAPAAAPQAPEAPGDGEETDAGSDPDVSASE
jgi:large subunit ribosomal protein L9